MSEREVICPVCAERGIVELREVLIEKTGGTYTQKSQVLPTQRNTCPQTYADTPKKLMVSEWNYDEQRMMIGYQTETRITKDF